MGRSRSPVRDLVRLPRRVPGCPRRRRPQPAAGVRERPARDRDRAARPRADRADAAAARRRVALARGARRLDVLELGVHRRRARAALGLPAPPRGVRQVPQHDPARERASASSATCSCRPRRRGCSRTSASPTRSPTSARSTTAAGSSRSSSNPYAAMPSLHAADALIVGVVLAIGLPDALAQGALAALAVLGLVLRDGDRQPLLARRPGRDRASRRSRSPSSTGGRCRRLRRATGDGLAAVTAAPRGLAAVKRGYTDGTRRLASRWITGLARTRVTPNALTASGITLCAVAAVLVYFGDHNRGPVLLARGGRLRRRLGAGHPRRRARPPGGKATPFGAFLDSIYGPGERGLRARRVALVFSRHGNEVAVAFAIAAIAGSFLVSYARAQSRGARLKATSASAAVPSASSSSRPASSSHRGAGSSGRSTSSP